MGTCSEEGAAVGNWRAPTLETAVAGPSGVAHYHHGSLAFEPVIVIRVFVGLAFVGLVLDHLLQRRRTSANLARRAYPAPDQTLGPPYSSPVPSGDSASIRRWCSDLQRKSAWQPTQPMGPDLKLILAGRPTRDRHHPLPRCARSQCRSEARRARRVSRRRI